MTAVLQILQDIARHLNVSTTVTPEQLRDLVKKTDVGSATPAVPPSIQKPASEAAH